jgi:hypothetical protein
MLDGVIIIAIVLAVYPLNLLLFGLPGLVTGLIGWLLASRIGDRRLRIGVRAVLAAIALAPVVSQQEGMLPASGSLLVSLRAGTADWTATASMLAVGAIAVPLVARWESRRAAQSVGPECRR